MLFLSCNRPFMYTNGGVNPRQPVDQDLSVSPNINALRATDSYLYECYMLFVSLQFAVNFENKSPIFVGNK